ncbi:hypothetical protein EMPG_11650 [Blastomyces silverae]|uniref:Uncharacterized protein n=1 Tax=Blastomyces silverae TaxID=2060906 RepID=A0A0H1BPE7_9EURO|nr:hypothetical protein EMPG_11650 [Blastomyces silverae]
MNPSNSPSSEARTAEKSWSSSKTQEQHQTAPSYANPVMHSPSSMKPKGAKLTEGGFDEDGQERNVSFTSEIGSEDDPGRLAERLYESRNAETPGEAAAPVDRPSNELRGGRGQRKGGQPYGALEPEEEA